MIKKFTKTIGKGLLAIFSLGVLLCLLVIIALQGFVIWLNTSPGGNWLAGQIESASKDSPYKVELKGFALSGLLNLRTAELRVLDKEGIFVEAHHVSIKTSPFPIALKRLYIGLEADQIQVLRTPLSTKKVEEGVEETAEIVIPDIYFKQLDLSVIIHDLALSEQVVADGLNAKIEIAETISLNDQKVENNGSIFISSDQEKLALLSPLNIQHTNHFDAEAKTLLLQELKVQTQENNLTAAGSYQLEDSRFDIQANGTWNDIGQIDQEITEPIDLALKIEGLVNEFAGNLSVTSAYKDIPASLSANLQRQEDLIRLSDITGNARDVNLSGNLSYNLSASVADGDLEGNFKSFDLLSILAGIENLSGSGDFTAKLGQSGQQQNAQLTLNINNLAYDDIRAASIKAKANMPNVKDWKKSEATITISDAVVPQTNLKAANIYVVPADQGIELKLDAKAFSKNPFSVTGAAHISEFSPLALDLKSLTLTAGKGNVKLSGTLKNNIPDFQLNTNALRLADLPYVDLAALRLELNKLDGTLNGTMAEPKISLDYGITTALDNIPKISIAGQASYLEQKASLSFSGKGEGIESLGGNVELPLQLALQPFAFNLDENVTLNGQADGNFNLAALMPIFLGDEYDIRGTVNMDTQIGGPLSKPELNGYLKLREGYVRDQINDVELKNLIADATFNGKKISLTKLQAQDIAGTGNLSGNGVFDLSDVSNPDINAALEMTNMHLLRGDQYDARLNADINFETSGNDYFLSGTITPQEIQINLPERFEKSIPTLNVIEKNEKGENTKSLTERMKLDMNFKAANQIFVRGWGLDAELEGDLNITGTAATPQIKGQLQTIRGRYEELGRRFDVDHARLRFQGPVPPSPYLDVKTSTELENITAHILITGRATDPELTFSSTPGLPEDEVLSQILFGEDLSKISPYQAVQLAQTLRRFSGQGGGGIDLLGTVRDVTGLDDIRVEGVGTENATVGAGKYITDNVYLELEQGTGEKAGSASVEIEVSPSVKVESKAGQNGDSDVGVFWEWDY